MNSQISLMSPCFFGITLQQGTQLVAAFNIFMSILMMIIVTIYSFMFETSDGVSDDTGVAGMVFVVWMIALLLDLIIHILLLKGANEKSQKKVKIYLIVSIAVIILAMIGALVHTFTFAMGLIKLLLNVPMAYELWVVYCFYKEISTQPQTGFSDYGLNGP